MGNLISSSCWRGAQRASPSRNRKPGHRRRHDGLHHLVVERSTVVSARPGGVSPPFYTGVSDLTSLARRDDGYVVNRKVGDARRAVLEAVPSSERKGRLYKEFFDPELDLTLPVKKPDEDLSGPFSPLTDEEENMVSNAMHSDNRHEVLAIHEASSIQITGEILQCLSYSAWLNDEVINLYLELLKEREKREPKKFLKCHFFNTFFYKKLISGQTGYDFKSVRRWTSQKKLGYALIECDRIFVPIHRTQHWCLAVIDVNDESFQYFDSLGGMDTKVLHTLARYFMDEVNDKSNRHITTMSWKQETVDDLPMQENGWDCGMFMLKYVDFYSRGLSFSFCQEHMPYFRKRTAKEILQLRAE